MGTVTATPAYWDGRAQEDDPKGMVGWAGHPFEAHEAYVRQLLSGFVGVGVKVLDVGCGYGRFAEWIISRGAEWFGIDWSPGMRAVWEEEIGLGNYCLADARDTTEAKKHAPYDLILCVGADGSLGGWAKVIELYEPLLKPPGHVVIVGPYTTQIRSRFS